MTKSTPKEVRHEFEQWGISISSWAKENGFSPALVYQVLSGKNKCLRGQSHRIAVALGLKEGKDIAINDFPHGRSKEKVLGN
ncbi:MAG: DNA-binding protein [Neptuniibacter sp.]